MDLTQYNDGIIVVTDVIVATWFIVIVFAQLKEHIQHQGPILTVSTCLT
jgi:hypothetical protein